MTITEARARVAMLANCFLPEGVQPSLDILTLALAELARRTEEIDGALAQNLNGLAAAHAALLQRFEVLAARERREHQPVSGTLVFSPGLPTSGTLAFVD